MDSEKAEASSSLAITRSRRVNAGSKMSQMIQEEEDEFYASTYGGFTEEEDDNDFKEEDDNNDVEEDYEVDSDFSIDETDEIIEHQEEDDGKKKRTRGTLSTRAYKEPKKITKSKQRIDKQTSVSVKESSVPSKRESSVTFVTPTKSSTSTFNRTFRESTKKKTEQTMIRVQQAKRSRRKTRKIANYKPLTQEELLKEAKKTEQENLKSLEFYQKLESERIKRTKLIKRVIKGPFIRYQSLSMPILETNSDQPKTVDSHSPTRYTRNFITFSDELTYTNFYETSEKRS